MKLTRRAIDFCKSERIAECAMGELLFALSAFVTSASTDWKRAVSDKVSSKGSQANTHPDCSGPKRVFCFHGLL